MTTHKTMTDDELLNLSREQTVETPFSDPDEDGFPFTYYVVGSLFKKGSRANDIDCISALDHGNKEPLSPYEYISHATGLPVEVFLLQLEPDFWLVARYDGEWVIGKGLFRVVLGEPTVATSCEIIKAARSVIKGK